MACEPQELASASQCFCDPRTSQLEVYLLALLAGVPPDPQALATAASAFQGMGRLTALQAQVWLLCQISGAAPPADTNFRITQTGDFRITEAGDFRIVNN